MGKHKIIKSAAAVALTASVVATAAAPGASAASYKTNAKDQLVHTSTGKLVKGWKVFGGKLYKNGKLAPAKKYKIIGTGAAQKLFYGPTLKKGYKTANSKTLLFKDGKLADGWKQAGKNERLYKNGKLDKGYTVYTNVEGDKFLYQNGYLKKGQKTATRGGETLLFVDGKLAKGYVLHEASKTLFNNGKVAEGLVKYPETDGKFYNDGKLANGEINGATYKDGVLVAKDVASVKAINDTTVEVTFKEAQKAENIKAEDFKIEGLTVSNAALKQTDSKVVVLTTSKQEAAKEYVITYKENDTKTFVGFNAVIPTAIKSTEIKPYQTSQQAKIGTQVTVKATVTVAEGANKAGIPVTFNVDAYNDKATGSTTNFNEDKTVEVFTDENGVATYSYTQYHAGEDTVYAYPTGAPTKRADLTKVYWGVTQPLTVTEEEASATLANDAKKVYKVKVDSKYIEAAKAGLKVTFAENYEVKPNEVNYKAKITDGKSTNYVTPYQTDIQGQNDLKLTVDKDGYATFTVTGANTSVTPVVFIDGTVIDGTVAVNSANKRLDKSELQATASTIKFDNIKTVGLTNVAQGVQQASRSTLTPSELTAATKYEENFGGRQYVATLTDKDGKTAPAGTKVLVKISDAGANNPSKVKVFDTNKLSANYNKAAAVATAQEGQVYELTTDKDGQIKYTVVAAKQANDNTSANNGTNYAYATPVAYLDNDSNTPNKKLDELDTQAAGEISYFGDAIVKKATLTFFDAEGKEVTKESYNKPVTVKYQTVDQNGFPYAPQADTANDENPTVTFQFDTTFGNLSSLQIINNGQVVTGNTNNGVKVGLDSKGAAELTISSDKETTVNVEASSSNANIDNVKATLSLEAATSKSLADAVAAVNVAKNTKEDIAKALAGYAAYETLTDAQKAAVVTKVLSEAKDGAITGTQITNAIADAKTPVTAQGTITKAVVSEDEKELTLTFDKDIKSTLAEVTANLAKFIYTGTAPTAQTVKSVSGNTVVLSATTGDFSTVTKVAVDADAVLFTDNTANTAIAAKDVTQPVKGLITLGAVTDSVKEVTAANAKDAEGTVEVGTDKVKVAVSNSESNVADYNGLKVVFKEDGAATTATFDGKDTITVSLGYKAGEWDVTKVQAAIDSLGTTNKGLNFAKVVVSNVTNLPTGIVGKTITLKDGIAVEAGTAGVYKFTLNSNPKVGDVISVNGKDYTFGGTNGITIAGTVAGTATNLAAAIKDADNRFTTATASSTEITLTDAAKTGDAAPVIVAK